MKTAQEDKRKSILDAARKLLVKRGLRDDDVALDDVAREAKVAKGTLFLYYRNKEDLFRAAFDDLIETLAAELDAVEASPARGRGRLDAVVRVLIGYFDRNKDFLSQASRFPGCKIAENHARVLRMLEGLAADGLFLARDLGPLTSALYGLCRSALLYKLISGKDESMDLRVSRVTDIFLHGAAGRR